MKVSERVVQTKYVIPLPNESGLSSFLDSSAYIRSLYAEEYLVRRLADHQVLKHEKRRGWHQKLRCKRERCDAA